MSRPIPAARTAAYEAGEPTYIGHPCAKGHPPVRFTGTGRCQACSRENDSRRIRCRKTLPAVMPATPTFVLLTDWRVVTP